VTDCEASKQFCNQLSEGIEKKITLFEVFFYPCRCVLFLTIFLQGGYHELHNEPDGVRDKLADAIIAFIEEHVSGKKSSEEANATSSGSAEATAEAKM